jgi:molecular chaperone DnaK
MNRLVAGLKERTMNRTTIDFGIDLGTTNSAIAVLKGTATEIVKNNHDADITSSSVYISKQARVQVGQRARNRLEDQQAADDVYIEFKRRMGTGHIYQFQSAGLSKTPEDLSAEILKSLRGDVQQRLGEDIHAAVITVPAAFEQRQCTATKKAGELAGLAQCPLLLEPVAAALAYGFQADAEREYWLVYDFGGGTFDAALMKADDGIIDVVNHGGDNHLGGSDIDWAIVEKLILPKIAGEFNLPNFTRGNRQWRTAFAVIKRSAEVAKIELSRSETAFLEDCRFKDADGEEVDLELKLTRGEVISAAEPIVQRSVDICKRVLEEKQLPSSAVGKVILVGGPTLAPYFREILTAKLGILLDHSLDPLTVVARGAAIFAGTQRLSAELAPPAREGEVVLDLKYSPTGPDEDPTIRGTASFEGIESFDGFTIQFTNQLTKWSSGKVPLKSNGAFRVDLLAEPGDKNTFQIELLDPQGTQHAVCPDSVSYTIIPMGIDQQPVINSLGIGIHHNEFDILFPKGSPLPARATKVYRTTRELKKGATGEVLSIPVLEGENARADRNRLQDTLAVTGTDIRRDLPADSEVEITLFMDESRTIRAKAYLPILDEEFEVVIDPTKRTPDVDRLKRELDAERGRLEGFRNRSLSANLGSLSAQFRELDELAQAAVADPDAADKAEARLLELRVILDREEDRLEWPNMVKDARKKLDELDRLISQLRNVSDDHRQRAAALRREVEEIIEQKREDRLGKKTEQVMALHHEVLFAQPEFWVSLFHDLQRSRSKMRDISMADRLFQQGQACMQRNDVSGLREVDVQLIGLVRGPLPPGLPIELRPA